MVERSVVIRFAAGSSPVLRPKIYGRYGVMAAQDSVDADKRDGYLFQWSRGPSGGSIPQPTPNKKEKERCHTQ